MNFTIIAFDQVTIARFNGTKNRPLPVKIDLYNFYTLVSDYSIGLYTVPRHKLDFSGIAVPRFLKGVGADKMTNLCPVTV